MMIGKLRERLIDDAARVGSVAPARDRAARWERYARRREGASHSGHGDVARDDGAASGSPPNHRILDRHVSVRAVAAAALWIACGLAPAGTLRAQVPARAASSHLEPGHWAVAAAQRLAALGFAPEGFGWGERALTVREVRRVLQIAAERAPVDAPRHAELARGYLERFDEEFRAAPAALDESSRGAVHRSSGSFDAGYSRREGGVLAGVGYNNEDDWTGAIPASDSSTPFAGATLRLAAHPHLVFDVAAQYNDQEIGIRGGEIVAAWRNLGIWVGRRRIGFGPGAGGGIVLTGIEPMDGVGIGSLDPFTLPGSLRHLGPIRFQSAFSRIRNGDRIRDPWFWTGRLALEPHARLQIGITRAVMLGGEGNSAWTIRNIAYVLVGKHAGEMGEFDNQVVAIDVHFRPPTGAIPILLYLEWGMDDSAGALKDVPAIVAGVFLPSIPVLPDASFRLEHTTFAGACCGNTIWYRNWAFRGGWTDDGVPLGHPLGGHGREWLTELRADLHETRLRMAVGALLRRRGHENLFAPQRNGDAAGAWLRAALRVSSRFEVFIGGAVELGETGWEERSVDTGLRWMFR